MPNTLADLPARIIFTPLLHIILPVGQPPNGQFYLLRVITVHAFYPTLLTVLTVENDFIARKPVLGARCLPNPDASNDAPPASTQNPHALKTATQRCPY